MSPVSNLMLEAVLAPDTDAVPAVREQQEYVNDENQIQSNVQYIC